MTNDLMTIPLVDGGEDPHLLPGGPSDRDDAGGVRATPLETARFGLLAAPNRSLDHDRRMEEWIASNLDFDPEFRPSERSAWHKIIDGIPGIKRAPKARRPEKEAEAALEGWARFQVAYKRGITLVRLIDKSLVRDVQIQELECELVDLIEAGNHRIVLNFDSVERLASMVIVAVDRARRGCAAGDGGALKICGLAAGLANIFSIAGVATGIEFHADEPTAINSPWPAPSGPRPLPVEILSALTSAADMPPIQGGSPWHTAEISGSAESAETAGTDSHPRTNPNSDFELTLDSLDSPPAPAADDPVWLEVQVGGSKGRPVIVSGPQFTIGRDQSCHLRLGSPMVSKLHATIELRQNRTFLRDLGSTNGTVLNGRPLRDREQEVHHGDRIQIGPIVATVLIGDAERGPAEVEAQVADWLHTVGPDPDADQEEPVDTADFPTFDDAEPERKIKHEIIQNILVITPQVSDLDDDDAIEMLRTHFHVLFEPPMPHRVVVNLEYIGHLSAKAIGVLLAHHLRLDRAGGAMRICQARARIMAVMHQVRLTMLVECHPTFDEAVLAAWPRVPQSVGHEV